MACRDSGEPAGAGPPPAVGGCAAHGDTLATRDSPRQCATTRPRVDTPAQLNTPPGSTERKFAAERNSFWRKLGCWWRSGQAAGQKCEEEEDDDDGWERCGSVKRKAALLYAEWSFYSAPTLIFQNRRVAYLTVSQLLRHQHHVNQSVGRNVALEVAPRSAVKRAGDHWNYGINLGRGLGPID